MQRFGCINMRHETRLPDGIFYPPESDVPLFGKSDFPRFLEKMLFQIVPIAAAIDDDKVLRGADWSENPVP